MHIFLQTVSILFAFTAGMWFTLLFTMDGLIKWKVKVIIFIFMFVSILAQYFV